MPLSVGDKLGPYEILARIGAGGMGEVWKARDTRLDRTVAIKQLQGPHSARFAQEARAIAALNHPHICTLHDVGPDYLVMEYVEGRPLTGPVEPAEALRLAIQIAEALEEAHARGILHRDLKPGNILVTAKGSVKLLDFGLAKLTGEEQGDATQTIGGTIQGTAAYMSPEQAQGQPLDVRSDIFSFGVVLYELLSGKRAFSGNSTLDVLNAVVRDQPRTVDAPAALTGIVSRAMSKSPADRFATVSDLRASLAAVTLDAAPPKPSVAVLPFANMGRDADDEYFSDGLAEEIINLLAQNPELKVIARTSAFAFKGKNEDIRRIAETLGVTTVVEGSMRRAGNRIRVTAQLIAAAEGSHLWSQRYDREMTDVFAVQDEISAAIAEALLQKLAPARPAAAKYQPKLEAYEAYLRARHHLWKMTLEGYEPARQGYEQAIALDPGYALPHYGLCEYYLLGASAGHRSPRVAAPLVRRHARRALELDPSLAEAHAALGMAAVLELNWAEVESHCQRALSFVPVPPEVHHLYGYCYLRFLDRAEENVEQQRLALQSDPLNMRYLVAHCLGLCNVGRLDEAERDARRMLEIDPYIPLGHYGLAQVLTMQNRLEEAAAAAQGGEGWIGFYGRTAAAGIAARAGHADRARKIMETLGDPHDPVTAVAWAAYYLAAGEPERAMPLFEGAVEEQATLVLFALDSCNVRPYRLPPGLARKLNLPV